MVNYGITPEGFRRKGYLDILEHMQIRAKELYGEDVNLSDRSPLGMFLQAIAWEISNSWQVIEDSHYSNFSLYANDIALDNVVANFGRVRFNGTKARTKLLIEAQIGTKIPSGFVVSTQDDILFEVLEGITINNESSLLDITSIDIGVKNNVRENSINKLVNPIAGIISITNPDEATGGSDIESDENLRLRNLEALREPATGDNIAQYRLWAKEVNGVGSLKVLPITPTEGFVTIVLADIDGRPANPGLIEEVFNHIELVRPVNAGINVVPATSLSVSITVKIRLAEGYRLQEVRDSLEIALLTHFKEIALNENYISHAQIGSLILSIKGVIDYSNLKLNNKISNIELDNIEVPILGVIDMELM